MKLIRNIISLVLVIVFAVFVSNYEENTQTANMSVPQVSVSGESDAAVCDAGVVRLASVSGVIWEDRDADRLPGGSESAMEGLNVNLMDGSGRSILKKTVTDAQGRFVFDSLKPGSYKLRVDCRDGYVFSGALEGGALPLESERDGRG